jgi:hypothetical protein
MSKARQAVELLHDLGLGEILKEMLHKESGFATALARSLGNKEIHLVLDLLDLGWTMKTPVSFLKGPEIKRLREILLGHADDPAFEKRFLESLKKPPVNQARLFDEFQLKGKDRGKVMPMARTLILRDPDRFVSRPKELEAELERELRKQRVVARFEP